MNKIEKAFLGSAAVCVLFVAVGVATMVIMKEISLFTVFPIIGGVYFACVTYVKYKEAKDKEPVEFVVRLMSKEKGDEFLTEEYHFVTEDEEKSEIFITGTPTLTDNSGKKLKKGYLYLLVYLTDDGEVADYNQPFSVTPVRGLVEKRRREEDEYAVQDAEI